MNPFIIPIFLPQMGCPFRCLYCHQERITRRSQNGLDRNTFSSMVEAGLSSKRKKRGQEIEIAFFGGTFTNLPGDYQNQLLEWGADYISQKRVTSLRLSTRPDALSESKLDRLMAWGVKTIELGVQSLDDTVLRLSNRGHTAEEALQALALVKRYPVKIGIQLMTGLPGDSPPTLHQTISQVIAFKPDFVRLYPTLVFEGTPLAQWLHEGRYSPPSLDETVSLCSLAVERMEEVGIRVIRLGLQAHDGMQIGKGLVAGPYHPAFGSLVRGEIFLRKILKDLKKGGALSSPITLEVAPQDHSYLTGNKKKNLLRLIRGLDLFSIAIKEESTLPPGSWKWVINHTSSGEGHKP